MLSHSLVPRDGRLLLGHNFIIDIISGELLSGSRFSGVHCLGLPILDLFKHPPEIQPLEVDSLEVSSRKVDCLRLPGLDLLKHALESNLWESTLGQSILWGPTALAPDCGSVGALSGSRLSWGLLSGDRHSGLSTVLGYRFWI